MSGRVRAVLAVWLGGLILVGVALQARPVEERPAAEEPAPVPAQQPPRPVEPSALVREEPARGFPVEGVVTLRGVPIEGAQVRASEGRRAFTVVSGSGGRFRFDALSADLWRIEASRLDAFAEELLNVPLGRSLALEIVTPWVLEGVVRDEHGSPIQGARVAREGVEEGSQAILGQATTGDDGTYLLRTLRRAGRYHVEAPGFADTEDLDLTLEQARTSRDFTLAAQAGFSGSVVDEHGEPLAGVTVFVSPRASDETRADGTFGLAHLSAGPHLVKVQRGAWVELTRTERAPTLSLRFELPRTCTLEGRILDGRGVGLPSLHFTLQSQDRMRDHATDAEGRFEVGGLPCRTEVTLASRRPRPFSETILLSGTITHVNVRVPELIELAGVVRAPDGQPIPFAKIFGVRLQQTEANEAGRFIVRVAAEERTVFVGATAPGYVRGIVREPMDRVHELRIVLQPDRRQVVHGRVVDTAGAPLHDFVVGSEQLSSPDGAFTVRPCQERQPCDTSLTIRAQGYVEAQLGLDPHPAILELGAIVLETGRAVQVLVRDSAGSPVGGAQLEAAPERDQQSWFVEASTFADGRGSLTGMPASGFWTRASAVQRVDGGLQERTSAWTWVASTADQVELQLR